MTGASETKRGQRGRHFYGPGPYVEREVDNDLFEALRAGEYALVFAARGTGKTSVRIRAAERLSEAGIRVASVDLGAIGAESRADAFCASLVIEAGRSVGKAEEAKRAWRRSKGPVPMRLRACLREVLLEPEDAPLVLFIDELELALTLGPARDDFFAALRAMADARGQDPIWRRLSVCLVGAVTRDELISDPRRSSFELSARELAPRDFSRAQLDAFAETLAPLGVDTRVLLDALYDWTSGSPALVQWICGDLLLREVSSGDEATAVEGVIRETFLQRGPEVDPLLGETARRLRRDRRDPYRTRLLAAYERVLRGEIVDLRGRSLGSEGPLIVARLKVVGLVAASAGAKLRVRNRIVERAFDRNWVRRALSGRPVTDALERWEAGGRRSSALLRGEALRRAVEWLEGRPDVIPSERDFVMASERARSRRLRGLAWTGGAACLSLGLGLGLLWWQYRTALDEVAESRALASAAAEASSASSASSANSAKPEPGSDQSLELLAQAKKAVEQGSLSAITRDELETLERELGAVEQRLANERAARAELLAPDPARRSEGLGLALEALSTWSEAGFDINDAPAPITRGLTANLASPGDATLIDAHFGPVDALRFGEGDAAHFITVSGAELRVWERDTGRRLANLSNLAGEVVAVALSPSTQRIAALAASGSLTVWDLSDGTALGPAPPLAQAPSGAPMPLAPIVDLSVADGGEVTLVRGDGSLDLVDLSRPNATTRLRSSALPPELAFERSLVLNPSLAAETRVAVVVGDRAQLWAVGSGQAQASVVVPGLSEGASVTSLHANPEGSEVLIGLAGRGTVTVWDTSLGTLRSIGAGAGDDQALEVLALSSEGELLASAGADRVVRVFSVERGDLLASFPAHEEPATSLAFTPDGAALMIGERGGKLRVEPLVLGTVDGLPQRSAVVSAEGVAATVHFDALALELRWASGQTSARWALPRPITAAALAVNGSRLALLYADGDLALVSGAAGPEGLVLAALDGRILDFALSEDGKLLAAAGEDRRVTLISGDGATPSTLAGHEAPVDRVAFAPDAARLASADRSQVVRIWDPATAAILGTFTTNHAAAHLACAAAHFVVVDSQGGAELWSISGREAVATFELGGEAISGVAVSPDGEWLAIGRGGEGAGAGVELWRSSTSEAIARFRAVGPITALRFSADGQTLLAVDGRGQLARWPAQPNAWVSEACGALASGSVLPKVCLDIETNGAH